MTENELARIVYNKGYQIHLDLGPGLLEKIYEECLYHELKKMGLKVEKQKAISFVYKDLKLENAYRIDLLVNNKLLIELKSIKQLEPVHTAQTLSYLKIAKLKLGLLINFNEPLFKQGIKRVVNGL